jgi:hypothetical protein
MLNPDDGKLIFEADGNLGKKGMFAGREFLASVTLPKRLTPVPS